MYNTFDSIDHLEPCFIVSSDQSLLDSCSIQYYAKVICTLSNGVVQRRGVFVSQPSLPVSFKLASKTSFVEIQIFDLGNKTLKRVIVESSSGVQLGVLRSKSATSFAEFEPEPRPDAPRSTMHFGYLGARSSPTDNCNSSHGQGCQTKLPHI